MSHTLDNASEIGLSLDSHLDNLISNLDHEDIIPNSQKHDQSQFNQTASHANNNNEEYSPLWDNHLGKNTFITSHLFMKPLASNFELPCNEISQNKALKRSKSHGSSPINDKRYKLSRSYSVCDDCEHYYAESSYSNSWPGTLKKLQSSIFENGDKPEKAFSYGSLNRVSVREDQRKPLQHYVVNPEPLDKILFQCSQDMDRRIFIEIVPYTTSQRVHDEQKPGDNFLQTSHCAAKEKSELIAKTWPLSPIALVPSTTAKVPSSNSSTNSSTLETLPGFSEGKFLPVVSLRPQMFNYQNVSSQLTRFFLNPPIQSCSLMIKDELASKRQIVMISPYKLPTVLLSVHLSHLLLERVRSALANKKYLDLIPDRLSEISHIADSPFQKKFEASSTSEVVSDESFRDLPTSDNKIIEPLSYPSTSVDYPLSTYSFRPDIIDQNEETHLPLTDTTVSVFGDKASISLVSQCETFTTRSHDSIETTGCQNRVLSCHKVANKTERGNRKRYDSAFNFHQNSTAKYFEYGYQEIPGSPEIFISTDDFSSPSHHADFLTPDIKTLHDIDTPVLPRTTAVKWSNSSLPSDVTQSPDCKGKSTTTSATIANENCQCVPVASQAAMESVSAHENQMRSPLTNEQRVPEANFCDDGVHPETSLYSEVWADVKDVSSVETKHPILHLVQSCRPLRVGLSRKQKVKRLHKTH